MSYESANRKQVPAYRSFWSWYHTMNLLAGPTRSTKFVLICTMYIHSIAVNKCKQQAKLIKYHTIEECERVDSKQNQCGNVHETHFAMLFTRHDYLPVLMCTVLSWYQSVSVWDKTINNIYLRIERNEKEGANTANRVDKPKVGTEGR